MTPKLIEPGSGGRPARELPIMGEEFLIGRGADCDLRLRDVNISRHHCLIRSRPGEIALVDLGSSNGSFVNGQRVVSQMGLKASDEIRIAEFRFYLDLGEGVTLPEKIQDVDPLANTFRLSDVRMRGPEGPQSK